jgi:hypothetical protein
VVKSTNKSPKNNLSFNGKNYFKEEINSDDDEDYKPEISEKCNDGNGIKVNQN